MTDIAHACAELTHSSQPVVVIDPAGVIQYANDAAALMLEYGFGELPGRNVSCLMSAEHAAVHDSFLHKYRQKAAQWKRTMPESKIVGRSRDLYCCTKTGQVNRIFLTVNRVDRPSNGAPDYFFIATLILIREAPALNARARRASHAAAPVSASHAAAPVRVQVPLSPLKARKCSVVGLDVRDLAGVSVEALHYDYQVPLVRPGGGPGSSAPLCPSFAVLLYAMPRPMPLPAPAPLCAAPYAPLHAQEGPVCRPPGSTNRQPPAAANRQPPPTASRQLSTPHQPPTANRQPPPTANRQPPPTANCQPLK